MKELIRQLAGSRVALMVDIIQRRLHIIGCHLSPDFGISSKPALKPSVLQMAYRRSYMRSMFNHNITPILLLQFKSVLLDKIYAISVAFMLCTN